LHFTGTRWPLLELEFKYTKGTGMVPTNPQDAVPKVNCGRHGNYWGYFDRSLWQFKLCAY